MIPAHSILYKNENPLLTWFIVYLCLWFTVLNWCNTKINLPQTLVTSAGTAYHKRASVFTTGVLMRSVLHICIHHRCFDEIGVTHLYSPQVFWWGRCYTSVLTTGVLMRSVLHIFSVFCVLWYFLLLFVAVICLVCTM